MVAYPATGTPGWDVSLKSYLTANFAIFVRPEDFGAVGDGATNDTTAFQAAIHSGNGTATVNVLLTPGKNYAVNDLTWDYTYGQVNIYTPGGSRTATLTYTGSAYMINGTMAQTAASAIWKSFSLERVELNATQAFSGWAQMDDVRRARFEHIQVANTSVLPTVAMFHIRNISAWSELTRFVDIMDGGSPTVAYFDSTGKTGTGTDSFARTFIDDIFVSNGTTGVCKFDMNSTAGVYDSHIGRIYGNPVTGVRMVKIAGSMGGTRVWVPQIEAPSGTAYCFELGTLNSAPTIHGNFTARATALWVTTPTTAAASPLRADGLAVTNLLGNSGVDVTGRVTAVLGTVNNPTLMVSASGGAAWPFTEFGDLVIQGKSGLTIFSDTGTMLWTGRNLTATTANLASVAADVNVKGKFTGKVVYNTNTKKPVWAAGGLTTDVWVDATGATAHTPI